MRTRTAKKLAQRIDLNYFKRPRGLRRWRGALSLALPVAGLLWLGALAIAGSRTVYSSGPVSDAHAFIEAKCEVCHTRGSSFRSHVTDQGCLTCHDAPSHPPVLPAAASARHAQAGPAASAQQAPDCATCHREHQGRVQLAATADTFCIDCHGDLTPGSNLAPGEPPPQPREAPSPAHVQPGQASPGPWTVAREVGAFPSGHPEFAVVRKDYRDPGTIRFNHEVHNSPTLRGPNGPEKLECTTCHRPEMARAGSRRRTASGLMAPITYEQSCARCHTLFFDERIDMQAPHEEFRQIIPVVERALTDFIRTNPSALTQPDVPGRRLPLNFPRAAEPPARTPEEWVRRRSNRAQRLLSERTCAYCHGPAVHADGGRPGAYNGPHFRPANIHTAWMPRARFDHAPHLMVQCASCHTGVEKSRETSDVLMPSVATCATCHAPAKGASSQCVECHGYHDWTKAQPVKPHFKLSDFK